jgi:hypothetical protein
MIPRDGYNLTTFVEGDTLFLYDPFENTTKPLMQLTLEEVETYRRDPPRVRIGAPIPKERPREQPPTPTTKSTWTTSQDHTDYWREGLEAMPKWLIDRVPRRSKVKPRVDKSHNDFVYPAAADVAKFYYEPMTPVDPLTELCRREAAEKLVELVHLLPDRNRLALRHRHGIGDADVINLRQIGELLGVCRVRAQEIERRAIILLRKHMRRKQNVEATIATFALLEGDP